MKKFFTLNNNNLKTCTNYTIAIAGNPNVGKSTIFNALTGSRQHTGNWTGKTVTSASGTFEYEGNKYSLVDIPGTYSLASNSEEEEIARDYIKSGIPDLTIVVVDATSLERNLYLLFQILEITPNVILCVNLLDEANKKGININIEKLSSLLNIPVVSTIAKKKKTLNTLIKTINDACTKKIIISPNDLHYRNNISEKEQLSDLIFRAEDICNDVCTFSKENYNERDRKIDKILTSRIWGIPIMLIFLGLIFWITIIGANYPSQLLSNLFGYLEDKLISLFSYWKMPSWITGILIDGMYKTLTWVVAVMLPPMAIFFPLFTLLEDLGYLPRIAFNLDNQFRKACSSGKQSLTMCMGFGCNAAGVVGCKIINSPREKLIAILTNAFVPCNGRFPFLITIATVFFGSFFSGFLGSLIPCLVVLTIVLIGVWLTLIISKLLSKTVLKGIPSTFMLELPPYRKPQISQVLIRSFIDRTLFVLGRAACVAAPVGIVIWLFANISIQNVTLLTYTANFLDPFASLLGLDGYILTAFILGIPANEIVLPIILMSYMSKGALIDLEDTFSIGLILRNNGWTLITAINTMIFTLLHFPCSTTLSCIKKETQSTKWTLLGFALPTICGIIICFFTNIVYKLLF